MRRLPPPPARIRLAPKLHIPHQAHILQLLVLLAQVPQHLLERAIAQPQPDRRMSRVNHRVQVILMHDLDLVPDARVRLPHPPPFHRLVHHHPPPRRVRVEGQRLEIGHVGGFVHVGMRLRRQERAGADGVLGDDERGVVRARGLQLDGLVVFGQEHHEVHAQFRGHGRVAGDVVKVAHGDVVDDVAGRGGDVHACFLTGECGGAGGVPVCDDTGVPRDSTIIFARCRAGIVVERGLL